MSLDTELVAAATRAVASRHRPGWHFVGAALRGRSGEVFTAVNLQAYVTRISVCAEPIALGQAVMADDPIVRAVAVIQPPDGGDVRVVSPCGMCREIMGDYASDLEVIVPGDAGPVTVPVSTLLPNKYTRS